MLLRKYDITTQAIMTLILSETSPAIVPIIRDLKPKLNKTTFFLAPNVFKIEASNARLCSDAANAPIITKNPMQMMSRAHHLTARESLTSVFCTLLIVSLTDTDVIFGKFLVIVLIIVASDWGKA